MLIMPSSINPAILRTRYAQTCLTRAMAQAPSRLARDMMRAALLGEEHPKRSNKEIERKPPVAPITRLAIAERLAIARRSVERDNWDARLISVHEAAHAVAAVELRLPFGLVRVFDADESDDVGGECLLHRHQLATATPWRVVAVSLAGALATREYGDRGSDLSDADRRIADAALSRCDWQARAGVRRQGESEARRIVSSRWDAVLRVAGALRERRTLECDEVKALARQN